MQSRNISLSDISTILEENNFLGLFHVPKVLYLLPLTKTEKMFLVSLFKLKYDFQHQARLHDRWFFTTTKELASMTGCKDTTVRYLRYRLAHMGLIQYEAANWSKGRATKYKILMPDF